MERGTSFRVQQFSASGVSLFGRRESSALVSIFNEIDVEDEMKSSSSVTFSLVAAHSEIRNWLRSCSRLVEMISVSTRPIIVSGTNRGVIESRGSDKKRQHAQKL